MQIWLAFGIGLFLGTVLGIFVMGLLAMARDQGGDNDERKDSYSSG